MADKTVRYVAGNFQDPNMDGEKFTANQDTGAKERSLTKGVVFSQIINQAKNTGVQVMTRNTQRSGNASQSETIQSTVGIVGDLLTIGSLIKYGDIMAGGLVVGGMAIQKGLEYQDETHTLRVNDIEAQELARQTGSRVDKWSVKR